MVKYDLTMKPPSWQLEKPDSRAVAQLLVECYTQLPQATNARPQTSDFNYKECKTMLQNRLNVARNWQSLKEAFRIQPCGDVGIVPSGKFVGLTGRKIIVDTYGGWGGHGGGAFSGKDFRQVDRTRAYLARWIAKSLVVSGLANRCCVQISYAIGVVQPVSVYVDTYGTSKRSPKELEKIVFQTFDMTPGGLAAELGLMQPIFTDTARNGHFSVESLPWEKPKSVGFMDKWEKTGISGLKLFSVIEFT